ncbi:uncharacterized protein LOC110815593 [Carica papaya]|uniref:uncharacterized protein LOC110815593 n=1 Tax=Carica papaya TaxID=3649 RepID=UPI000B8CDAD4|nr:uncharacterized protein LOC110815593 [Carica papaya]
MPNTKANKRGAHESEKNRRGRLAEKASSFHGRASVHPPSSDLRRPKTVPDLLSSGKVFAGAAVTTTPPRLTKLLLNVTIQGSLGPVQVVMAPENTVGDLVTAAVRQYVKEGRRPLLPSSDASRFDLHYSQFSLESLEREEKLISLGSRNFFLCQKKTEKDGGSVTTSSDSKRCSKQAETAARNGLGWLKFMDFLL